MAFFEQCEYGIAVKALQIPCFVHLQLFVQYFNFARSQILFWHFIELTTIELDQKKFFLVLYEISSSHLTREYYHDAFRS